jgi:sialate O-acetylesterase
MKRILAGRPAFFLIAALAASPLTASGLAAQDKQALALAPVYSDHMVLQRDHAIPVRGTASPSAHISVEMEGYQPVSVTAGASGAWEAVLPAMGAATGLALKVTAGAESIRLEDIAVGDVFLCSGQSNMEFPLRLATDADNAIAASNRSELRLFHVPRQSGASAQSTFASATTWRVSAPDSTREFSAACYFMGVELQRRRQVPIGLIAASWGGSFIEAWLGADTLLADGQFSDGLGLLAQWQADPVAAERKWLERTQAFLADNLSSDRPLVDADPTLIWEQWGNGSGDSGFADFDGFGTYTTTVTLSASQAMAGQRLMLGLIDDIDHTVVNGQPVGMTAGWDVQRNYALPQGLLRQGVNRIEVRVLDTGGGGGLYGTAPRAIILRDGASVELDHAWRFRPGRSLAQAGAAPQKPWMPISGLGTLANGMIAPLGRIPLAGIAWYQGESNASRLLPLLMAEWRERFDTRRFAIVQLANFGALNDAPGESHWAQLRDVQRRIVAADRDAGLAIAIDVGDPYDIHPANKRSIGVRLASAMDGEGHAQLPVAATAGDRARLTFAHDLVLVGGASPVGFELCSQNKCRFVDAQIIDASTVSLHLQASDDHVRYLWSDSPVTNLYDRAGIPVTPFQIALPGQR